MELALKLIPSFSILIGVWFITTFAALGRAHPFVRFYVRRMPQPQVAEVVEVGAETAPDKVAQRILTSSKVNGCHIVISLFTDRVERYVKFGPSLSKRMGGIKVVLDTVHQNIGERSTLKIVRDTEQFVRDLVKKVEKPVAAQKAEYIPKTVAAPALAFKAPEVVEATEVEHCVPHTLAKYTGRVNEVGIDTAGSKPVYFVDLVYRDGAVHRVKGWGLKHSFEKSEVQLGDFVELSSAKVNEKIKWNVSFFIPTNDHQ